MQDRSNRRRSYVGIRCALLLAVGVFGIALPARAATTAEVRGIVVDEDRRPLAGVTLVLGNDGQAFAEQGRVTDAAGKFRFPLLPPGSGYRVLVSLQGYATLQFRDIELNAGGVHVLEIALRPESEARETVRVRGKAEVVNTESPVTSTTFSSEFMAGLPVLGRDYQDILTLAPGVTDVNGTGNPNIHGARDTDMVTLVDGVSTTDPFTGHYGQNLNIEAIQEIEVITSGATADFSRAQGGFANILTKSGGNEFRGTFKMFLRTSRLDGDGAGIDSPELRGGIGEAEDFRSLTFTDLYPFLSLSGAMVKDHLWYYLATEYIQQENPVNAVTQAFVIPTRGYRGFLKSTWQIASGHKLVFSLNLDHTVDENLGIDSLTSVESGYSFERGGPTYTLKENAVLSPRHLLESTASWFDNGFAVTPTTNPDTNHNGILFVDAYPDLGGNGDGIYQARELDSGEDYDRDQAYDIWEDRNNNRVMEPGEDLDRDGRLTSANGCEGADREDYDCDGRVDQEVDLNHNGIVDPAEDTGLPMACILVNGLCTYLSGHTTVEGTAGNGLFDTEDRNGNGVLDVVGDSGYTPFPFWADRNGNGVPDRGEFQSPLAPDRGYLTDYDGRTSGPYPYQYSDHRQRFTLREDFSIYLPEFLGAHDLKLGAVYEHEGFDRDTLLRPILRTAPPSRGPKGEPRTGTLTAFMGVPPEVNNTAGGNNLGLYLQDTYKPLPNLTLGLGLRFDLEDLTSYGYTSFDPREERRLYSALTAAAGLDVDAFDSVVPQGLCADPLFGCGSTASLRSAQILSQLKSTAPKRLTRHNADIDIQSPFLRSVLGRDVSLADLLASGVNPRRPEEIRIQNNNLAPRLSVTWDPMADGKSKVFASWNRYYDKLFLNTMVLEEGPDQFARIYVFDKDGVDDSGRPDSQVGKSISQSPATAFQIDRDLRTPFSDELTAGYSRELVPELSVSITYIQRDYRDQLQDVDLNHHTALDPNTGRFLDRLGSIQCGYNEFSKALNCANQPDNIPDLYVENFFLDRVFRLGNYNSQTYRGWELELARRLSRKWQMMANYTYSVSRGNAESFLSEVGDDPSLAEFEPGFLNYDQRHVVNVSATAFLPGDWQLGGIGRWASGLPYSVVQLRTSADDAGYIQERLLYGSIGRYGFETETRNSHRNQSAYDFSARVQKNFVVGKASASGFFEVFNILNSDSLRIYQIQQDHPSADYSVPLRVTAERRFGRRFEFGVQFDF